jgi:hypothetical protein
MTSFFLPGARTPEDAEETLRRFIGRRQALLQSRGRLRHLTFTHGVRTCTAVVGKTITNWLDKDGVVVAILETSNELEIYTAMRHLNPILINKQEVRGRLYFDDYPQE